MKGEVKHERGRERERERERERARAREREDIKVMKRNTGFFFN